MWFALRLPSPAGAEQVEPETIEVPTVAQLSMLPDEARLVVDRAVARCRREQSPEAFAALGRIYHGNGLARLGAECYEIAIRLGSDDAVTPYLLGLILFEDGRHTEAAASFRRSIERDPGYPLAHHHLARSLLAQGRIEPALDSFAKAVELDPNDPVLHTGLAKALRNTGRLDDAETSLRQALALDSDHHAAHQLLGLVLHATDRSDEAELHLSRIPRYNATVYNDPWTWEAYRHAASVEVRLDWVRNLLRYGRVESALGLLSELSTRHPHHSGIFRALGNAHLRTGDHQRAINAFARAADIDPADAQPRLAMAQILLAYELLEEAEQQARKALAIDPDLTEAIAVRGGIALREGRLDDARRMLERAIERRPDYLQAAGLLGETLIAGEHYEEAVDVLTSVLAISTGSARAYAMYQLAVALTRLGRLDEAEQAIMDAAAIDPANEYVQQKIATLQEMRSP